MHGRLIVPKNHDLLPPEDYIPAVRLLPEGHAMPPGYEEFDGLPPAEPEPGDFEIRAEPSAEAEDPLPPGVHISHPGAFIKVSNAAPDLSPIVVEHIARTCHAANVVYAQSIGDQAVDWLFLDDEHQESIRGAVRFYLKNPDVSPQRMHALWVTWKKGLGWSRGPRDDGDKKHPNICDWEDLPEAQRRKDVLFCNIVDALRF